MADYIVNKLNIKLFDNISAASNIVSEPLNIQSIYCFCVQITWKNFSARNPKISLLVSNSLEEEFVEIDNFTPTGNLGGEIINIERAGYGFIKIQYSCSSGTGNITVSVNGKV